MCLCIGNDVKLLTFPESFVCLYMMQTVLFLTVLSLSLTCWNSLHFHGEENQLSWFVVDTDGPVFSLGRSWAFLALGLISTTSCGQCMGSEDAKCEPPYSSAVILRNHHQ